MQGFDQLPAAFGRNGFEQINTTTAPIDITGSHGRPLAALPCRPAQPADRSRSVRQCVLLVEKHEPREVTRKPARRPWVRDVEFLLIGAEAGDATRRYPLKSDAHVHNGDFHSNPLMEMRLDGVCPSLWATLHHTARLLVFPDLRSENPHMPHTNKTKRSTVKMTLFCGISSYSSGFPFVDLRSYPEQDSRTDQSGTREF